MNAGDAGSDQELRETFLARRSAQRHAVQQNLIAGGAKQKSAAAALVESAAQFFPSGLKLRRGSHVTKFIKTREF
jgi:hypothetical protein